MQTGCGMGSEGDKSMIGGHFRAAVFLLKTMTEEAIRPVLILYPGFGAFLLKRTSTVILLYIAGYLDNVLDNKIR
jgi:hypothetical protein